MMVDVPHAPRNLQDSGPGTKGWDTECGTGAYGTVDLLSEDLPVIRRKERDQTPWGQRVSLY